MLLDVTAVSASVTSLRVARLPASVTAVSTPVSKVLKVTAVLNGRANGLGTAIVVKTTVRTNTVAGTSAVGPSAAVSTVGSVLMSADMNNANVPTGRRQELCVVRGVRGEVRLCRGRYWCNGSLMVAWC